MAGTAYAAVVLANATLFATTVRAGALTLLDPNGTAIASTPTSYYNGLLVLDTEDSASKDLQVARIVFSTTKGARSDYDPVFTIQNDDPAITYNVQLQTSDYVTNAADTFSVGTGTSSIPAGVRVNIFLEGAGQSIQISGSTITRSNTGSITLAPAASAAVQLRVTTTGAANPGDTGQVYVDIRATPSAGTLTPALTPPAVP